MSITLLREVTERVNPPRALFVDRPLGYPLGEPNNAPLQREIMLAALELVSQKVQTPLIVEFRKVEAVPSSFR
ncbi:MAG: hypothetical protein JST77_18205 [Acidobacteria bacterium]|nr:hypothetical protein [Acidobacteriota bacterium]